MERLYLLILFLETAAYLMGATPPLAAQEYCSLKVVVVAPNGQHPEVPVAVHEKSGRTIEKRQDPSGDVRFCDLGIQPVKVVVGLYGCNQVVIDDVPLSWQERYTLKVTYDPEPCVQEQPPPPTPICKVLFRISAPDGRWITKATLRLISPNLPSLQTDSAGRAYVVLRLNDQLVGSASAPSYTMQKFSFTCSEPGPHEEILTLREK